MRIVYWNTSCLQPEIEAVSKEVFQLARHFRDSLLVGINPHYQFCASFRRRYIGFHPRLDLLLRILIPLIEQTCDISHVYGEAAPWTFYKTLRRKPLILTIASEKGDPRVDFLERCRKVVVQTDTYYQKLLDLGIDRKKIEVLYPGVDLVKFRPLNRDLRSAEAPKVLFATAPRSKEEMESRGVYLLLEAAKENPQINYHLLYRKWRNHYTSLRITKEKIEAEQLKNVILTNSVIPSMTYVYHQHHFTVIPYTSADGGKSCPVSLIEGMACGLPVLISSVAPLASFVWERKCGVVFEPTPSGLIAAVKTGMNQYVALSTTAVRIAKEYFSEKRFLERMGRIYQEVMA